MTEPAIGLPRSTIHSLRRRLEAGRRDLAALAAVMPAADGTELVRRTTALVDLIVGTLVAESAAKIGDARLCGIAVIALGGYGRAELCPHSDIDLLFLVGEGEAETEEVRAFVDAVLYGLWDLRFEVGHAVRTITETLDIAAEDQSVLTALLDARLIPIGDGHDQARHLSFSSLSGAIEHDLFAGQRAQTLIDQKLEEAKRRRSRYGNSVYLLEPNVKESEGGLRELHTAMWIAHARWRVKRTRDLLHVGVLSSREERTIERAYGFLLRVRSELHLVSGRRQDILSFEYQEAIADRLGFVKRPEDPAGRKFGVERFMRAYYFNARQLRIQAQSIVERATSHRVRRAMPQYAPGGFKLWHGMLTVAKRSHFEQDPTALVRIFQVAQEESLEIYSYTKELISSQKELLDESVRRDPRVVEAFLQILEEPKADGSMLDLMHDLGVLRRLIPEVSRMTARWQHSLYHVYTVDAHSIFVVKNLKRLRAGGFTNEQQEMTRLMAELPRPVVLYMAAFLHDIGKGWRHGDHSERGARVARTVGERFEAAGLPSWSSEETADLVWLVKEHLTMSTMSQRRDVSDRALLDSFADDVRDTERLTMLYLLTFADMKGTSPKVWTDWKGLLLTKLYHNTKEVLRSRKDGAPISLEEHELARRRRAGQELAELAKEVPREVVAEFTSLMPTRYILTFPPRKMTRHLRMWRDVSLRGGFAIRVKHKRRDGITELTIVCPDRPGLLALLAGTLAANGLLILSAQIFSVDLLTEKLDSEPKPKAAEDYDLVGEEAAPIKHRAALDVLYVKDADGSICDDPNRWAQVREDLERVFIADEDDLEELIDARVRGSTLAQKHRPEVETKLVIANDASKTETVIDVFCQDHLGALYTITKALADQGLSISLAKISTEGDRVADGFYVTDAQTGEKIEDPARFESIVSEVKKAVRGAKARASSVPRG